MSASPRTAILSGIRRLREAGVPDPEHDAALLLSHLTGGAPLTLRLDMDTHLDAETLAAYEALLRRRAERIPLQHLLGTAHFEGHDFAVDDTVLIPRPETGLLVQRGTALLQGRDSPAALDLCCGSGCIGISLALACPSAKVVCADLSERAVRMTRRNALRLGAQVRAVQGDLFAPVGETRFDLILSNPPYIPTADCAGLQPEVLHDPLLALDGGVDGLAFYRRIAAEGTRHLKPGGALLLEIGAAQAEAVSALLAEAWTDIRITEDAAGLPRMVEARPRNDGREV